MATNNYRLHTQSHQETLNSVCHSTLSLNSHPLSKSSSNLASIGRTGSGDRQNNRQELRKSRSSSACQTQVKENNFGSTPSSGWSSTQSEIASTVRTVSSLSPSDNAQCTSKSTNHFLCSDQSPASEDGMGTATHIKTHTVEMSPAYGANAQYVNTMEGLGAAVQRSLSDLTCSCKQQSSVSHMETSITYSAMSSNKRYEVPVGNAAFQRPRYGSDSYENDPYFESHMTQVPSLPKDQNVPTNIFSNGAITHNVAVFTDPRAYHTTVLASHMPGDHLSNRAMYAQGGIIYSNFSPGMHNTPGMMAIHNSTALPYNIRQESSMKVEGTIPAYCHSLPIPSVQFLPRLVCSVSESGKEQVNPGYCPSLPATETATLPKLVSSVSESGLDVKRLLRYCHVHGEHVVNTQPYVQPGRNQQERKTTYVMLNSHQDGVKTVMKTKDTWTMTSMNDITQGLQPPLECRDAEVQTIPTKECKSVATSPAVVAEGHPHVFPEVNLEPEAEGEKSPVREVRWDDEGMTWEVYGAAVDPEVLGLAIQKHLEIQIEQFQTDPVELSRKSTEEPPAKEEKEEKKTSFRTMMFCLKNPSCCARGNTAVE